MTLILLGKSPKLYVLEKFTRLYASIIKMISLIAIIINNIAITIIKNTNGFENISFNTLSIPFPILSYK